MKATSENDYMKALAMRYGIHHYDTATESAELIWDKYEHHLSNQDKDSFILTVRSILIGKMV